MHVKSEPGMLNSDSAVMASAIVSETTVQSIIEFYQESNVEGILNQMQLIAKGGLEREKTALKGLIWPIPTGSDFEILSSFIKSKQISTNIFSIGCGTGLLEYLLLESLNGLQNNFATLYRVTGIEIDSLWWQSKYAPPLFHPIIYVGVDFSNQEAFGDPNSLVLFSYFNCLTTFTQYLKAFQGNYVGIIGPVQSNRDEKIAQFCAPSPLDLSENPNLPLKDWELVLFQRFGLAEMDYIGIYSRMEPC